MKFKLGVEFVKMAWTVAARLLDLVFVPARI